MYRRAPKRPGPAPPPPRPELPQSRRARRRPESGAQEPKIGQRGIWGTTTWGLGRFRGSYMAVCINRAPFKGFGVDKRQA